MKQPVSLHGAVARAAAAQYELDGFWRVRELVEADGYVHAIYEDGREVTVRVPEGDSGLESAPAGSAAGHPICPRCANGRPICVDRKPTGAQFSHEETCATYVWSDTLCAACASS